MKRPVKPNAQDLTFEEYVLFSAKYANDLEKYCDELKKALEKACRRLAKYDQIIYGDDEPVTAQDYYDWSFEDD